MAHNKIILIYAKMGNVIYGTKMLNFEHGNSTKLHMLD